MKTKRKEEVVDLAHIVINNLHNTRVYIEKTQKIAPKEASQILGHLCATYLLNFGTQDSSEISKPMEKK